MNERQRAYYEKLKQFRPADASNKPPTVVYTGGEAWKWKCAGCGHSCIGEPISTYGSKWYCFCASGVIHNFHRPDERTPET